MNISGIHDSTYNMLWIGNALLKCKNINRNVFHLWDYRIVEKQTWKSLFYNGLCVVMWVSLMCNGMVDRMPKGGHHLAGAKGMDYTCRKRKLHLQNTMMWKYRKFKNIVLFGWYCSKIKYKLWHRRRRAGPVEGKNQLWRASYYNVLSKWRNIIVTSI